MSDAEVRAATFVRVASGALLSARIELGDLAAQPNGEMAARIRQAWDALLSIQAGLSS